MTSPDEKLSRRSLLRGALVTRSKTLSGGWSAVEGLRAGAGQVFWNGWADEEGVFVGGDDGIIVHYDGTDWHRHNVPAPVPIHAFWGTHRQSVWAVGWMGLILHFDGETWQQKRGCVVDEAGKYSSDTDNTPLFDICGLDDGRAWAVGDRGTILHFDGESWQTETSGVRQHLRSVIALPDGRIMASGGDGAVVIRNSEGVWEQQDCPIASNFTTSVVLDDDRVLLAGGRYFIDANGFRGDLVLFDGETCTALFKDQSFSRFRAVGKVTDGVLTIGDSGQIHLIRGERIDRLACDTSHDLLGLIRLPGDGAMAVGDFGTVLVGDAEALSCFAAPAVAGAEQSCWSALSSGTDRQLWGVWTHPVSGQLYACGEEGTVLCLDHGAWQALPPVGKLGVHDMALASDGGLLAVGQLGEIHHFDGEQWRKQFDLHMDITLLSIWSDGQDGLFTCGDEGLVLNWNGTDWERMPSGTRSALYGLWGTDAEHLLAVGDFGQVMRWNGTRWDEFNAGTEHFLFDVWGRALNDIYIVGLSGTIGHFNGQRWNITPVRARNDLLAITGTETEIVAVGAAGAAVYHRGNGWQMDSTGTTAGLRAVATDHDGIFYAVGDGGTIMMRQQSETD